MEGKNSGFQKAANFKKFSFLAPEILAFLKIPNRLDWNKLNLYKLDVFSLGLVIMEAATLKKS